MPPIELEQGAPVAARQVDAADRALEQDVAGEDRLLAGDREGEVARAVAGREQDVDLEPGELELLAALAACGRPRSSRTARSPANGT